jgi:NodT family efflux transporter outer membrane factor (OMF) lipoprotein
VPAAFREAWKPAAPRDQQARGAWWEAFGDPVLSRLESQVSMSNQILAQSEAKVRQAQALVQEVRAAEFPTVTVGASVTRSRGSSTIIATPSSAPISRSVVQTYSLPVQASWEPDLWGSVRRNVEANRAALEASVGDLEAARLLAQATLAQDYFLLRDLDTQRKLYDDTLAAYEKAVQLTQNQYNAGVAARADVVTAQTQLKTAQAQAIDLGVQRAQLEHAIAVLVGEPPETFVISPAPIDDALTGRPLASLSPDLPLGLPSELLERRPDIAAAERRMAEANAQIGVAMAAYFPTLNLSGSIGFQSATFAQWLTAPSRFWSLGPALAETIFDGGLRRAQTAEARANYDANVAAYRQTVLAAFQDVEDNLAALRILEEEARTQDEAVALARRTLELTINQYRAGTVSFIIVVAVQNAVLTAERTAIDLLNRRLSASVLLVKALGGGWSTADMPANMAAAEKGPSPASQASTTEAAKPVP